MWIREYKKGWVFEKSKEGRRTRRSRIKEKNNLSIVVVSGSGCGPSLHVYILNAINV